jgi:prepilin-type N-terminal cleavage/methylation domain-containing protein
LVKRQGGFTLLELLVAIVLAGVLALLVYAAAGAAFETRERLAESRAAAQATRGLHVILTDALRNARPAARFGDTALLIEDRVGNGGQPSDRLSFVTSGATPPLTSEVDWRIVVQSTLNGAAITATPLGLSHPKPVVVPARGITGMDVRALPAGTGTNWSEGGAAFSQVPRALEITWWSDSGAVGLPLRVAIPWGRAQ